MRRTRRRYRRRQLPDPFANLGLGDPGYRVRPGASGLDPMETYTEGGRMLGILLKSAFQGRLGPYPVASLAVLIALVFAFLPGLGFVAVGSSTFAFMDGRFLFLLSMSIAFLIVAWAGVRFALRSRSGPTRRDLA